VKQGLYISSIELNNLGYRGEYWTIVHFRQLRYNDSPEYSDEFLPPQFRSFRPLGCVVEGSVHNPQNYGLWVRGR
jgi:hypothetical protein